MSLGKASRELEKASELQRIFEWARRDAVIALVHGSSRRQHRASGMT